MSPDVLLECPRTSFRDVLRVNVTERVWHSPPRSMPLSIELCSRVDSMFASIEIHTGPQKPSTLLFQHNAYNYIQGVFALKEFESGK